LTSTSGKLHADEAEDALKVFHTTHREATRLCLMAARRGATDAEIADALLQVLPIKDTDYLQDESTAKQPEGTGATEKGNEDDEQENRSQQSLHAADAFVAALGAIPTEDWQDLSGWSDEHAAKDLEENQTVTGQDASACICPLEQELLGRHPQWHSRRKAKVRHQAVHGADSPMPHHKTFAVGL